MRRPSRVGCTRQLSHHVHRPAALTRPSLELLALIAHWAAMAVAAVSIRNLDERVKERLRVRAARQGRSKEAEIRGLFTEAGAEPGGEAGRFRARLDKFGQLGGVELDSPARAAQPRAADLG